MLIMPDGSESQEEDVIRARGQELMDVLRPCFQETKKACEKTGLSPSGSMSLAMYDLIRKRLQNDGLLDCGDWRLIGNCKFALHFKDVKTGAVVVVKHRPSNNDRRYACASRSKRQQQMFDQPFEDSLTMDLFGEPVLPDVCIVIQWYASDNGSIVLEVFKPKTPGSYLQDPDIWYLFGMPDESSESEEFRSVQSAPSIYGSKVSQNPPDHRSEDEN